MVTAGLHRGRGRERCSPRLWRPQRPQHTDRCSAPPESSVSLLVLDRILFPWLLAPSCQAHSLPPAAVLCHPGGILLNKHIDKYFPLPCFVHQSNHMMDINHKSASSLFKKIFTDLFWLPWVRCCAQASLVAVSRGCSVLRPAGFFWRWLLCPRGSVVLRRTDLAAPWAGGVFLD